MGLNEEGEGGSWKREARRPKTEDRRLKTGDGRGWKHETPCLPTAGKAGNTGVERSAVLSATGMPKTTGDACLPTLGR